MKVYHFIDTHYGLEAIMRRRLKLARINELNDPFDHAPLAARTAKERKALRDAKNEFSRTHGILCFSESWRNPVQWSHYADRHRGLCLGFEFDAQKLIKVEYVNKRPALNMSRMNNNPNYGYELVRTKFVHWQYEQEHRAAMPLTEATNENGLYFAGFSDQLRLSEVIVGHLSPVKRQMLNALLGDLNTKVKCTKARLAFKTFEVVPQRNASLWQ